MAVVQLLTANTLAISLSILRWWSVSLSRRAARNLMFQTQIERNYEHNSDWPIKSARDSSIISRLLNDFDHQLAPIHLRHVRPSSENRAVRASPVNAEPTSKSLFC